MVRSMDTDPKTEAFQIALIRKASVAKRFSIMRSLSQTTIFLSRRAIKRANPTFSDEALDTAFVAYHYGEELAEKYTGNWKRDIVKQPDILVTIKPIVEVFEKLGISYYISGSVASSAYGIARATMDVDMVANLNLQHAQPFIKMVEQAYYVDEDAALEAIKRQSSFNLIHFETMLKVDIFILKDEVYAQTSFRRRRKDTLEEQISSEFYFVSPEDIILNKLEWYRLGGGVSERQWKDVVNVLNVQKNSLDMDYLEKWAAELKLTNLLQKAFDMVGIIFRG